MIAGSRAQDPASAPRPPLACPADGPGQPVIKYSAVPPSRPGPRGARAGHAGPRARKPGCPGFRPDRHHIPGRGEVIPRRSPQLLVVGHLRQVIEDIHDALLPFIAAAIVDGLPFALTTNGGSPDGHLRRPTLTRKARRKDRWQRPAAPRRWPGPYSARNGTDRGLADRDDRRLGPSRGMRPRRVNPRLADAGPRWRARPPRAWLTPATR